MEADKLPSWMKGLLVAPLLVFEEKLDGVGPVVNRPSTRVLQPYIYLAMRGRGGNNTIMTYTDPSHREEILVARFPL